MRIVVLIRFIDSITNLVSSPEIARHQLFYVYEQSQTEDKFSHDKSKLIGVYQDQPKTVLSLFVCFFNKKNSQITQEK